MTGLVSVLVPAYGPEPYLADCIASVLGSEGCQVEILVVDNGCAWPGLAEVQDERVTVLRPGTNLGYSGACNLAGEQAAGDVLVLLNSDAEVDPSCLATLAAELAEPTIGIVQASIRLFDRPDTINSAGNPVHVLGFAWAGGLEEPAARYAVSRDVTAASGACLAIRAETWRRLGGFDDAYFAYHEDVDLSLRCWLGGLRVRCCADAVARHHYEFSRNPEKFYLLERNRLVTVLSLWEGDTLRALGPAFVVVEIALLGVAVLRGFGRAKLRSWAWLVRHRRWLRERRRRVQSARTRPDADLWPRLTTRFDPVAVELPVALGRIEALASPYWRAVSRRVARGGDPSRGD